MKKVLLFLAQGFEEYEAAVFTDILGWSRVVGDVPVEVVTAGLRPEIQCTWSLIVKPQAQLKDLDLAEFDALAIPGGFQRAGFYEDAYHEDFLEAVRHFDKTGKPIAAICVGAMPVGKSGVLTGRNATTYHLVNARRRKQLAEFGAVVLDQHVVVDRNIITSTGPATGLEVAFILLEMLTTRENVEKVQEAMAIIDPRPL